MLDLHSHLLPGINDGAPTLAVSLEMARLAVADGIHTMTCTPHIYPGMYMNDGPGIALAISVLHSRARPGRHTAPAGGRRRCAPRVRLAGRFAHRARTHLARLALFLAGAITHHAAAKVRGFGV